MPNLKATNYKQKFAITLQIAALTQNTPKGATAPIARLTKFLAAVHQARSKSYDNIGQDMATTLKNQGEYYSLQGVRLLDRAIYAAKQADKFAADLQIAALTAQNAPKPDAAPSTTILNNLSLLLLAKAAHQAKSESYENILDMIVLILDNEQDKRPGHYDVWIFGRIAQAAKNAGDTETLEQVITELSAKLSAITADKDDMFSAWARGYLAGINDAQYRLNKDAMLAAVKKMANDSHAAKTSTDEKIAASAPMKLIDAIWACIMAVEAAGNAKEKATVEALLEQLRTLEQDKNHPSVYAALASGLKPHNFPRWAEKIIVSAMNATGIRDDEFTDKANAALLEGEKQYAELNDDKFASDATLFAKVADITLGRLTTELDKLQPAPEKVVTNSNSK